ncbi:MAG: carboxypeptidase regulatory-like domain-containing protein [Firmicutes bacterium]|nr:carboxypeptidase regulatory-like domain-containing protein [Bacillota bacterium]
MLNTVDEEEYVGDLEDMGDGRWVIDVREGEYELEISSGFDSQWVRDITVEPGSTLDLTVHVQLGDEDEDEEDW